jgi:hypothetical protein
LCAALTLVPNSAEATDADGLSTRISPSVPPPTVTVDPTKEGAKAKATTKKKTRLKSSRKHKPSKKAAVPPPPPAIRPAAVRLRHVKELRLNIGMCGRLQPDGTVPGPTRCQPEWATPVVEPTAGPTVPVVRQPRPQDVSWEQVLSESKDAVFPGLHVKVQPAGRTLVNLDTIVYTEDSKVSTTTVTLLGFPVVVEATPMSYRWSFGDGATVTTTSPGKPYPAKEITHKYMKRGGVRLSLTTNYAARFNVAGTGWQYIDGTVPITGPATPLLIREAVPVLVDPPR